MQLPLIAKKKNLFIKFIFNKNNNFKIIRRKNKLKMQKN